ncbi:glycogen debranching enzyme [Hortaea werneckii]|nr:glycogen debranching enzyme [Hortaea werneckii]
MAALLAIAALAAASPLHKHTLDTDALAKYYFGNDAPWYKDRIPYFECSDKKIQDVFYYRWKIFRAHQRDTGIRGYVSTEFLEDVSWQLEPWATLNDATGFHLGEGQWLRDRRFADDYINHMYNGGNDRHFTDWMEQSVWRRYTVDVYVESLTIHLADMIDLYNEWDDAFDDSKGLYWREPLADATEYTLSSIDASGGEDGFTGGEAFRPSINSYMWANARAIADTARVAGQDDVATDFDQRAATLKDRFQTSIWNTSLEHFIDRYYVDNENVSYWDPIRGRELVGLVPWMFGMPDDNSTYSAAWKHLLDPEELRGSGGMRTVEPSYEYYMRQYRYAIVMGVPQLECQWNGPVWPYQTTQILYGMANLLNDYNQTVISRSDYLDELRRYTDLHYVNGTDLLDLQEDYNPDDTGTVRVGLPRSDHYFHSGYNDLIISGLVGLRPRADDMIEVNPLIPEDCDITSFRLQDILYHGRSIAIEWGFHGLHLEVDGETVASSPKMGRLTASMSSAPAPEITRPMAKSIQLVRGEYPLGSASSSASSRNETENVHDAIDGRTWFFPELPHGWDSEVQNKTSEQWYKIDFGNQTEATSCELALFVDGGDYVLPNHYEIQVPSANGSWNAVWQHDMPELIANGVTTIEGDAFETKALRLAFTQEAGKRVRLAEFKVY